MKFFILFFLVLCACSPTVDVLETEAEAEVESEEQPFEVQASVTITGVGEGFEAVARCPEGSSLIEGRCETPGFAADSVVWSADAEHPDGDAWRCNAYVTTPRYVRVRATAVCE